MNELKLIKKKYGESMVHLCKRLFPTILETDGLLYSILSETIFPSKSIGKDITQGYYEPLFLLFIYNYIRRGEELEKIDKTPAELLDIKGYDLYECKTNEEVLSFQKYFAKGEELCTFNENRLNNCYVFFAVKKDVDNIKREDFKSPDRQDEYGTSVMSIQFTRGTFNCLSIKNRYNHTVFNPDATFSNNLENIIPGLTNSFQKHYGLNIIQNTTYSNFLTDKLFYIRASDNLFYKANHEKNNIYYCENNIIIDCGKVIDKYYKAKERYLVFEYFILDLKEKKISLYDKNIEDSFVDSINIGIKKIEIKKQKDFKVILIYIEKGNPIRIVIDERNKITEYENDYVTTIGDYFLTNNRSLKKLRLGNVKEIGNYFLENNKVLEEIELDKVERIGNNFLKNNNKIKQIDFPSLLEIGNQFMAFDYSLEKAYMEKVKQIGSAFLFSNKKIESILMPNVEIIGNDFLRFNHKIEYINFANLRVVKDSFLYSVESVNNIMFPKLVEAGSDFMVCNKKADNIYMPLLEVAGPNLMYFNEEIGTIYIPNIKHLPASSFAGNKSCNKVYLESLESIDSSAFLNNDKVRDILINDLNVEIETPKMKRLFW